MIREFLLDQKDTFYVLHRMLQDSVSFDDDHGYYFKVLLLPEDEEVGGFPDGTPFDDMPSGTDVYLFEAGFKKDD